VFGRSRRAARRIDAAEVEDVVQSTLAESLAAKALPKATTRSVDCTAEGGERERGAHGHAPYTVDPATGKRKYEMECL
jgi:hypothetical protein